VRRYNELYLEGRLAIRVAIASWFLVGRFMKKEDDYHDEQVVRELNRYQSYLAQLVKYRKAKGQDQNAYSDTESANAHETKSVNSE
jgi:uncharacterized protein YgiB involved in biofilm formation